MPRPRFTIRRMMVAVALSSVPLALTARGRHLEQIALRHEAQSRDCLERAGGPLMFICDNGFDGMSDEEVRQSVDREYRGRGIFEYMHYRQSQRHAALAESYHRAARYPWLPVVPDPLGPK